MQFIIFCGHHATLSLTSTLLKSSLVSALNTEKLSRTCSSLYNDARFPFLSLSSLSKLSYHSLFFFSSADFQTSCCSYCSYFLAFSLSYVQESRPGCSARGSLSLALCVTEEMSLSYCTLHFCNAFQNEYCLPSAELDCCIHTGFLTPINPALSPTHSCLADCYPHWFVL